MSTARSPELPRGRHQGQPHLLRKLSRLPADGADRARRQHRSRDVDDDVEQELRLAYTRDHWQARALPSRHLRATAARRFCAPPIFSSKTSTSRPVRTSTRFSRPSSFTSTSPAATASRSPMPAPASSWRRTGKPIVWTEEERKKEPGLGAEDDQIVSHPRHAAV